MHPRTRLRHWNTREKHTHDMHTRIVRVCFTRELRARIGVYEKNFCLFAKKENANDFHKQFAPRRKKRQTNNSIYENNNDVHSG